MNGSGVLGSSGHAINNGSNVKGAGGRDAGLNGENGALNGDTKEGKAEERVTGNGAEMQAGSSSSVTTTEGGQMREWVEGLVGGCWALVCCALSDTEKSAHGRAEKRAEAAAGGVSEIRAAGVGASRAAGVSADTAAGEANVTEGTGAQGKQGHASASEWPLTATELSLCGCVVAACAAVPLCLGLRACCGAVSGNGEKTNCGDGERKGEVGAVAERLRAAWAREQQVNEQKQVSEQQGEQQNEQQQQLKSQGEEAKQGARLLFDSLISLMTGLGSAWQLGVAQEQTDQEQHQG